MRMHRGSSKGASDVPGVPEALPLSASPPFSVVFDVQRGGRTDVRTLSMAGRTTLRAALRSVGEFAEGSAVFEAGRSLPLDTPIVGPRRFQVVPTFSGG